MFSPVAASLTVVVSGSTSSLLTSPVEVSSRRGWAALQAGSAAQAWKRLSKPACVLSQNPGIVAVDGKGTVNLSI
jgi:hypothetical protein